MAGMNINDLYAQSQLDLAEAKAAFIAERTAHLETCGVLFEVVTGVRQPNQVTITRDASGSIRWEKNPVILPATDIEES